MPTITTVARLANVSVASASRVLNGIRTNPATLARVTEAAESVGYVPNAAARSLRSRRTWQIAFAMVRDLKHRYVDGLILASLYLTEAHADELRRAATPVVVIGRPSKGTPVDTVRAYSRKGAAEAVRHLHSAGRRRIAFVNGPTHTAPGSARRLGYLDGLRSCGLLRDENLIEVAADFMVEPGRRAAERLLARVRPDAILGANDLLAVGVLAALRDAQLDVPEDVALVGMDNSDLSELTWPALTTVDLGSAERARIAAELLLTRIDEPGREAQVVGVEPRLIVRASSGLTS